MDIKKIVMLAAFLGCAEAGAAQQMTVDRVAWLQGCWRSTRGETTIDEQWMAPRAGVMLGMGRTVRGSKLVEYELVLIKEHEGKLAYEAHPSGQPTATFTASTASDSSVVFENPQHDFPQRVGYRRNGADALDAWIEGQANGKARRVDFSYQRARCEAP
jgi:hypothetical protein